MIGSNTTAFAKTCLVFIVQQARFFAIALFIFSEFLLTTNTSQAKTPNAASEPTTPSAEFGLAVRSTDARSAEDEQLGFHLPPGFKVTRFAAEPQIAKPLNMAFDIRGRLWITQTYEYPTPAGVNEVSRDSIQILEDLDGDGSADKVTPFADNLNIPIGLLPYGDGVICFSIPDILYLRDTDGDLICDQRIRLLGPFDTSKDTHGMVNSLRLGQDGWIYACHGFSNHSIVTASDGSKVDLMSGNTFRFRPDGSRIEPFTQGQVNPFGMSRDRWGDWYSADCHSKPISRLIRGGCYQSFGRPSNGLGFVPDLMKHLHRSTAISGLACYEATGFPEEYRGDFFSGNVMTSRINRNRMVASADAINAIEQPDFMTSDDPWFRPVDLQVGPDDAIYVADFYNKIIGHYEVPLDHPDRDRFRGRIWRITWDRVDAIVPNSDLMEQLGDANGTRRSLALQDVVDNLDQNSESRLRGAVLSTESIDRQVNALWALARRGKLLPAEWVEVLKSADSLGQVQAYRCATEFPQLVDKSFLESFEPPRTEDPYANLVIAQTRMESLSVANTASAFAELLKTATSYPSGSLLHQAGKIGVRRALVDSQQCRLLLPDWHRAAIDETSQDRFGVNGPHANYLAGVLMSLGSEQVAGGMWRYLKLSRSQGDEEQQVVDNCLRYLPLDQIQMAVKYIQTRFESDLERQADWIRLAKQRYQNDEQKEAPEIQDWAVSVLDAHVGRIHDLLAQLEPPIFDWHENAIDAATLDRNRLPGAVLRGTWQTANLKAEDQRVDLAYYSSLTRGESYVGQWASESFISPKEFSFWLAGHDGYPKKSAQGLNFVELIDSETGEVIFRVEAPRRDIATKVTWETTRVEGRAVRVLVTDGDAGNAYAWIAVGRFSVAGLNPSAAEPAIERLSKFLALLPVEVWQTKVESLISTEKLDQQSRFKLAESYARAKRSFALASVLASANELQATKLLPDASEIVKCLEKESTENQNQVRMLALEIAKTLGRSATSNLQTRIARQLIGNAEGRAILVQLIDSGDIGSQSLNGLSALLPASDPQRQSATLATKDDANSIDKLRAWCLSSDAGTADQDAMLQKRISVVAKLISNRDSGKRIFEKNCQSCHQLAGNGFVIGPQLDGVKARGLERLSEDLLLPHRNVDVAFRSSTLLLDDGTVVSGLVRSSDAKELRIVKNDGKESTISVGHVISRQDSDRSLMPDNFGDLFSDQQLADLLVFLAN